MGESKRKRLHPMGGATHVRPNIEMDVAIEEFEKLVEANMVRGFFQIAVCETGIPGVSALKSYTLGLEKQEAFDAISMIYHEMKSVFGFKEPSQE